MQKLTQLILTFLILVIIFNTNAQSLQDQEIENITNKLVEKIGNTSVDNIAVADFTNNSSASTELGRYLAEEFSLALTIADKNFNVIDRSRVKSLLEEQGLANDGLLDPNTVAKLGNVKGIDAIVSGSLTSTGDYIRLIIKVLDLETAALLTGTKGDLSKNPTIMNLSEIEFIDSNNPNSNKSNISKNTEDNLIERGEFKKQIEGHDYEFYVEAGQSIEVQAKPVGSDLNLRLNVFNPAGGTVYKENANSKGDSSISFKSNKLGSNGKYKIQILNYYYKSGRTVGAGIGVYDIEVRAKNKE